MARAGLSVVISTEGTPTVFTDATTTTLGGNRFQITDINKRILSPGHAVVVEDDGTPLATDAYTVNYLFGIVTLDGAPSGAVTVTARYLPMLTVAEAMGVTINVSRVELDTNFTGTDYASLILGRKSGTVSLESARLASETMDAAELAEVWEDVHDDATPKLLQVDLGGRYFRAWGVLPGLPQQAPADGLVSGAREFRTVVRLPVGRSEAVSYGFGT